MKGWHKHGVCADKLWPYLPADFKPSHAQLTKIWGDSVRRPLGAYFRVNHKDIVAMHSALTEVGILYATAVVHRGWDDVGSDGIVKYKEEKEGGHAFAIVAYDERGFWIQNSWGGDWGHKGFCQISYDDWLENGTDVWVARLGAPVVLAAAQSTATAMVPAAQASRGYVFCDLRPHIISIGNDGQLRTDGTFGTSESDVTHILTRDFPRLTKNWTKKRLLLYAHGGLTSEDSAIQRVAEYRATLLEHEVYPISFVWKTDYWSTLTNILEDAVRKRRPEGFLDASKDFMLDRLDDALEPLARVLTGKSQWDEMKENALASSSASDGGARFALQKIRSLSAGDPAIEIHMVGHSAGSILLAGLVDLLAKGAGPTVETCTLWAPAMTTDLFADTYLPAIKGGRVRHFALFTLTDQAERDDNCARIYNKSLLYLVSHAFEAQARIPLLPGRDGIPLLGLEKSVQQNSELSKLFASKRAEWVLSPNNAPEGSAKAARSTSHGDFDDDDATLKATLARILGQAKAKDASVRITRSAASRRDRRQVLSQVSL
jgi:hypothetical protein